jgi:hypothetical protein
MFQVIFRVLGDTFYLIRKQEQKWEDNEDHRDLKKMKMKVRNPNLATQLSCNLTPKFELAVAVLYLQVVAIAGECQWPIL